MDLKSIIAKLLNKKEGVNKETLSVSESWYSDKYESLLVQRNIFFLISLITAVALSISVLFMRYIKTTQSIEPFVIQVEEKTGVPTVVDPVTIQAYSANDAVVRYFIMKYIKAREEYYPALYRYNFDTVVRVLSSESVYYSDYKPKFSMGNPQSPVNILGANASRTVALKSIIFPTPGTAQVRFALQVNANNGLSSDKIALIQYEFTNINMNEDERLINPLGFRVINYKMDDERLG